MAWQLARHSLRPCTAFGAYPRGGVDPAGAVVDCDRCGCWWGGKLRRPLCTSVVRFHVGMDMDVERISAVRVVDSSPWRQPSQSCRCCLFSLHIYHGCYSATTLQEAYARAIGMLNLRKQLINEFSSGNSRWMLAQVLKLFAPLLCDSVLLLRSQRLR